MSVSSPYDDVLLLLDEGKRTQALDLLREIGRDRDPLAHDEVQAELQLEDNHFAEAAGLAERTIRGGRQTTRLRMIAADAQWYLGRVEEARAHADAVEPDNARAAFLQARIAYDLGEFERSEDLARRAAEDRPDWVGPRALALAARTGGGERNAHLALRLLWKETHDRWAFTFLMRNVLRRPEDDWGDDLLLEASEIGMSHADLLSHMMWFHNSRRRWDAAIEAYENAPESAQSTAWNLAARGRAALGRGTPAEAVPYLERSYALDPLNEWTVDFLFKALVQSWKWVRAIQISDRISRERGRLGADEMSIFIFYRNLRYRSRRNS